MSNEINQRPVKHKRRYCRVEGCSRIVKSQGLCQRHGAKPKLCRVPGCTKQAQGNFDGMCKSHFKAQTGVVAQSAYGVNLRTSMAKYTTNPVLSTTLVQSVCAQNPMPLAQHLFDGLRALKPPGWHRNEERLARGLSPVQNLNTPMERWESELLVSETLVITAGMNNACLDHMAYAWGREKGFHTIVLAQLINVTRPEAQTNVIPNISYLPGSTANAPCSIQIEESLTNDKRRITNTSTPSSSESVLTPKQEEVEKGGMTLDFAQELQSFPFQQVLGVMDQQAASLVPPSEKTFKTSESGESKTKACDDVFDNSLLKQSFNDDLAADIMQVFGDQSTSTKTTPQKAETKPTGKASGDGQVVFDSEEFKKCLNDYAMIVA